MVLACAVILCLASGLVMVSLGLRPFPLSADYLLFRTTLAVGYGIGIFSVTFFFSRILAVDRVIFPDVAVLAFLIALFLLFRPTAGGLPVISAPQTANIPLWYRWTLTAALLVALGAAIYAGILRMLALPHGIMDAFAIWNLHARFLFLGGPNWRDGFTAVIPWSHADYPLLLPAAIAHFWTYLGHDDPRVPAALGFTFTFATVGLLFSALSILRGRTQAALAAIALLATPTFIEEGTAQYADVPLAFFSLATVVLICLDDYRPEGRALPRARPPLLLAGLALSFAAWTKNEGLLFLGAIFAARLFLILFSKEEGTDSMIPAPRWPLLPSDRWRTLIILFAATMPGMLLIAYFKHSIAPPGDLFAHRATMLYKLTTPARYWAVLTWYAKGLFRLGKLLLVGLYFVVGKDDRHTRRPGFRTSILAIILTLMGYFAVYLITPYDLVWHLSHSLGRLFLQVWPSALFLFFLAIKGPERLAHGLPE